jgi:hypothetical protein
VAKLNAVEVHGTLWVMDGLVEVGLLAGPLAAERLRALIARTGKERRYLPRAECQSRIEFWSR